MSETGTLIACNGKITREQLTAAPTPAGTATHRPVPHQDQPTDVADYLRLYGKELGDRVVAHFPPLYQPGDPVVPEIGLLKRKPFAVQTAAMMGILRRWQTARTAAAIAECGTGKTLVSLGSIFADARGKPFTALALVPGTLVEKWARECLLTIPGVRVFVIDGVRNGVGSHGHTGVNEVRLRHGRIVREGLKTTLSDVRLAKGRRSPRARWNALVPGPSVWICSRDRGKLNYFWRHSYQVPKSGPHIGHVVNPDTGKPVLTSEDQLRRADFKKAKHAETVFPETAKCRRTFHSPLWQADNTKIARMSPIEFIGRRLKGFFDYAIADEVHELKGGATAQGNALGTLAAAARKIVILTGTLLGGYADELFFILHRLDARRMVEEGFEYSEAGVRQFMECYGVLEKLTTIEPSENACSKARVKSRTKRRPGASPLLFGKFLLEMGAFVSLEDISEALPPYREEILSVEMDPVLKEAYEEFEEQVRNAIREHPGNSSVVGATMNGLLVYPDHPYGLGRLWGYETDPESGERSRFLIAEPRDLPQSATYAKEKRLIEEVQRELNQGRRVQVFAVYTQKYNVLARLCERLRREGVRAEVLTASVPPEQREAWYEKKLRQGMQVCLAHPKLVQVGLDLIEFPVLLFHETGYSTYVLRQASRRSWRIGQRHPVRVGFLMYEGTTQERCLRLMGKKLLVSLAMEGKLAGEGLHSFDEDDDVLTAMARELVTKQNVGEQASVVWKRLQAEQAAFCRPDEATLNPLPDPPSRESEEEFPQREWREAVQLSLGF